MYLQITLTVKLSISPSIKVPIKNRVNKKLIFYMSVNFILNIMISIVHTNKNGFVTYEQADDLMLLAIF